MYISRRDTNTLFYYPAVWPKAAASTFFQAMIIKEALIEHSESNLVTVQANF